VTTVRKAGLAFIGVDIVEEAIVADAGIVD
jgi:hypothetical protein